MSVRRLRGRLDHPPEMTDRSVKVALAEEQGSEVLVGGGVARPNLHGPLQVPPHPFEVTALPKRDRQVEM